VPDARDLDFRGVHAVNDRTAYLLASGEGNKSRIYKTTDRGNRWTLQYTNPDPKGFFDGLAFWDAAHGMVVGDPVDGRFVVLATADGGVHWDRRNGPEAFAGEGAFAASNTCLAVRGNLDAWFATGGTTGARVFHSLDGGRSWTVAVTPIRHDGPSAGIFSLAFSDDRRGVAVGGDYTKPADDYSNIAVTDDGGKTWTAPSSPPPRGFRSAVVFLRDRRMWISTGTSGSDFSLDGRSWRPFDTAAHNALSFVPSGAGWAVGPNGGIARFVP
jgi:photosystem II stability/assembly factor-like uncharacterized protein